MAEQTPPPSPRPRGREYYLGGDASFPTFEMDTTSALRVMCKVEAPAELRATRAQLRREREARRRQMEHVHALLDWLFAEWECEGGIQYDMGKWLFRRGGAEDCAPGWEPPVMRSESDDEPGDLP